MEHIFTVTAAMGTSPEGHQLRSDLTAFLAETDLAPSPQLSAPKAIRGRLVPPMTPIQLTPEQFRQFKFKPDVIVSFEGWGYTFGQIEIDGTFELSIIHQA